MNIQQFLESERVQFSGSTFYTTTQVADWLKDHDTLLINFLLEEVKREVEKYQNAKEIMQGGQRYLLMDNGEKLPYGYPYPDTKEKYTVKSISTIIGQLKLK